VLRWPVARLRPYPLMTVGLAVLLGLLAFLQYRWLGQVSDGERRRLQATLDARARDFAAEFDREIATAVTAFTVADAEARVDVDAVYAARWDRWQSSTVNPRIVSGLYRLEYETDLRWRQFNPSRHRFEDAAWPDALRATREHWISRATAGGVSSLSRLLIDDLADAPALVVPSQMPLITALQRGGTPPTASIPVTPAAAVLVWFDVSEIRRTVLPALVKRYFDPEDLFDYRVRVTKTRSSDQVVYDSDAGGTANAPAGVVDASAPMFRIRLVDVLGTPGRAQTFTGRVTPGADSSLPELPPGSEGRVAVSVLRLATSGQPSGRTSAVIAINDVPSHWTVRLSHRSGSLDTAVAKLRTRNLAISSTILVLLAIAMTFVLVSTRRARRLAAQQVEFVASVSHELRTPLAVIRSAGENLADGIVDERMQVRRYGSLIADEGRKLGAMVEQVMEFAGMQADHPRWQREPVDIRAVVGEAVAAARRLPESRDAELSVDVETAPASLTGDHAALVRAVQNMVENALKYGSRPDGTRSIGVRTRVATTKRGGRALAIDVSDCGPGVTPQERKRIFEAFVRGRVATDARVSGNGLGLSIVRRVAEGHGGRVEVGDAPGGGAVFSLVLPS
jgi:signal transduction histidine kinase